MKMNLKLRTVLSVLLCIAICPITYLIYKYNFINIRELFFTWLPTPLVTGLVFCLFLVIIHKNKMRPIWIGAFIISSALGGLGYPLIEKPVVEQYVYSLYLPELSLILAALVYVLAIFVYCIINLRLSRSLSGALAKSKIKYILLTGIPLIVFVAFTFCTSFILWNKLAYFISLLIVSLLLQVILSIFLSKLAKKSEIDMWLNFTIVTIIFYVSNYIGILPIMGNGSISIDYLSGCIIALIATMPSTFILLIQLFSKHKHSGKI